MIERTYKCDVCKDSFEPRRLVGLWFVMGDAIQEKPPTETERHICFRCLASLQNFVPRCVAGIKGCSGGPKCTSDHK